jgi:hypothetical protein
MKIIRHNKADEAGIFQFMKKKSLLVEKFHLSAMLVVVEGTI